MSEESKIISFGFWLSAHSAKLTAGDSLNNVVSCSCGLAVLLTRRRLLTVYLPVSSTVTKSYHISVVPFSNLAMLRVLIFHISLPK